MAQKPYKKRIFAQLFKFQNERRTGKKRHELFSE